MPSPELKPCKWCGEYPLHVVTTEHHRHIYECDNPHCPRFGCGTVVEEPTRDAADAALIVAAVNGRAALSAVLRDMAKDCEAAWEGTPLRRALAKYFARLREIAGEGETPTGKGVEA